MAPTHRLLIILVTMLLTATDAKTEYYITLYDRSRWRHTMAYVNATSACSDLDRGRYMASVHSETQLFAVVDLCRSRQPRRDCWVGLTAIGNITYAWTDGTETDDNLIDSAWCIGYPLIAREESIAYIDVNESCFKNTLDRSPRKATVCGPIRKEDTLYHIAWFYAPLCLFSILAIDSVYIFIFLKRNLLNIRHNWILEPSNSIKCTALCIPGIYFVSMMSTLTFYILRIIGWQTSGIIPTVEIFPDDNYPYIWNIAGYMLLIGVLLLTIVSPIGLLHILLRMKHVFDHNEYAKQSVPSCSGCQQSFYVCMQIAILLNILLFLLAACAIALVWNYMVRGIAAGLWVMDRLLVSWILLYYYSKGLKIYAEKHYFRWSVAVQNLNTSFVADDRIDELLIEISRHVVVFGIAISSDFAFIGSFIIQQIWFADMDPDMFQILTIVVVTVREILFLEAVHLSFKFSHVRYENRCKCIDRCIKRLCRNVTKRKHDARLKEMATINTV